MNRRTALFSTFLLGSLLPRRLLAQDFVRGRRGSTGRMRLARRPEEDLAAPTDSFGEEGSEFAGPSPDFPNQPGLEWKSYRISRYTSLASNQTKPQNALIEWIFRRTGWAAWHGEQLTVLSASRSEIRACNTPAILKQVDEIVERFTDQAYGDILKVRVRFVAAADPRWRYVVHSRMTPLGMGPQGQQIWSAKVEDAAMVLAQMGMTQGFKPLTDQSVSMVNGQTLTIKTSERRNYIAGLQRSSTAGLGFQPTTQPMEEGVVLRLSPLLTYEGNELEADLDLVTNTIRTLHRAQVLVPREIGPGEATIEVPEVSETRLKQTIRGWPLDHTLVISAGIQPGILQSKTGFLNLRIPGTVPTSTELLVFVDARIDGTTSRLTRSRD